MKKNLLFIALLLVGLISCDNKTEEGPIPSIQNYLVTPGDDHDGHRVMEAEVVLIPGEKAIIKANLSGDKLKNVQLDIHWAGDHDHDTHARLMSSVEDSAWVQKIDWEFGVEGGLTESGQYPNDYPFEQHIDIPIMLGDKHIKKGGYHFVLHLWDVKGTDAPQQVKTVEVHEEGHDHE